ncbi:hypothetical protein [Haladaptatus sp. DYF46]|uniref:hypothetical protein n=1 Tax=Haladaptatus sp. DYF46 TaxID=2886041 RepID=UPI001E317139|nr:hypothetical protein [Haladaptatus sp. DYF46]
MIANQPLGRSVLGVAGARADVVRSVSRTSDVLIALLDSSLLRSITIPAGCASACPRGVSAANGERTAALAGRCGDTGGANAGMGAASSPSEDGTDTT